MFYLVIIWTLLAQCFCGSLKTRIVGGKEVDISQYPFHVSLQYKDVHSCGGSLLKPNIVLSAAHCTYPHQNEVNLLTVRAGSTFAEVGKNKQLCGEVVNVVKVHDHPKYIKTYIECDISVLILEKPFTLSENVNTIQLIPNDLSIQVGSVGTTIGWGFTKPHGEISEVLRAIDVPKVDWNVCKEIYWIIKENMVCYGGEEGKSICVCDSGSPVIHYIDDIPFVAGVVALGHPNCGEAGYPGIFADIQDLEIYEFIVEHAGLL